MIQVVIVNIICVFLSFLAKDRRFVYAFPLAFVLLTIFYGIRYDFGNDYWNYWSVYEECTGQYIDFDIDIEPGWNILCYLSKPIGYFGFVFVLTVVDNFIVFKMIRKHVNRQWWWLAMFIFVFTFNFMLLGTSMMRQYLAMLLCVIAIPFIYERKLWKFLLVIGIAFSIHQTSIILLPTYLFAYLRPKFNSYLFISCTLAFIVFLIIFSEQLFDILGYATELTVIEKYSSYLSGDEGIKSVGIVVDLMMMCIVMKQYPKQRSLQVYFCILMLSFLILPFTFKLVMLVRLMLYFSFFSIVCYPKVFQSIKYKWISYPIMLVYIAYSLRRSLGSYTGETYWEFFEHYQTIFSSHNWI